MTVEELKTALLSKQFSQPVKKEYRDSSRYRFLIVK